MDPIDFYFDFSCPYAYLASTQLDRLALDGGRAVRLRPFLLGGVFHAIGQAQNLFATLSAPKARHNRADVARWATWFGVPIATPLRHPNRTVDALRALIALPESEWPGAMATFFRAYWVDRADLADPAVIRARLDAIGHDGAAVTARAGSDEVRALLRQRTDAAIAAGVFGAPAFVVDGELFWGQDRLPLVAAAARGWRVAPEVADFRFVADVASPGGP